MSTVGVAAAGGTQTANAMRTLLDSMRSDPIQANLLAVCPASQSPPRLRSASPPRLHHAYQATMHNPRPSTPAEQGGSSRYHGITRSGSSRSMLKCARRLLPSPRRSLCHRRHHRRRRRAAHAGAFVAAILGLPPTARIRRSN